MSDARKGQVRTGQERSCWLPNERSSVAISRTASAEGRGWMPEDTGLGSAREQRGSRDLVVRGRGERSLTMKVFFSDGTESSRFLGRSKESGNGGYWPRQDMMRFRWKELE